MNYSLVNPTFVLTLYAIITIICWSWVGLVAMMAIFSIHINDTVLERIGLAWVSIGCFSAAWRVIEQGYVSDTVLFVSMGFGFYVTTVFLKCWRCANYQPQSHVLRKR